MLLESALADLFTDGGSKGRVTHAQFARPVPSSKRGLSSASSCSTKPKVFSKGHFSIPSTSSTPFDADAVSTKVKHIYRRDLQQTASFKGPLSGREPHNRELSSTSSAHLSRSPPPPDLTVAMGTGAGIGTSVGGNNVIPRQLHQQQKKDNHDRSMRFNTSIVEDVVLPFVQDAHSRIWDGSRTRGTNDGSRGLNSKSGLGSRNSRRFCIPEAAGKIVPADAPSTCAEVAKVGKLRVPKAGHYHQVLHQQQHPPPGRVISMKDRNHVFSASPTPSAASGGTPATLRSLASFPRPPMFRVTVPPAQSKEHVKLQQQQRCKTSISQTKNEPVSTSSRQMMHPREATQQSQKFEALNGQSCRSLIPNQQQRHLSGINFLDVDSFRGGRGGADSKSNSTIMEQSPVSILDRIPSPPTTISSGSSEYPFFENEGAPLPSAASATGAAVAAATIPCRTPKVIQQASVPGLALARRGLPSFSSSGTPGPTSSAHGVGGVGSSRSLIDDSLHRVGVGDCDASPPRTSTSSSVRYREYCLVAMQEALVVDPQKSKRFEDYFVELDTFSVKSGGGGPGPGGGSGTPGGYDSRHFARSPLIAEEERAQEQRKHHHQLDSPAWVPSSSRRSPLGTAAHPHFQAHAHVELKPEYIAVDFYSDSDRDGDERNLRTGNFNSSSSGASSGAGSPARSMTSTSTTATTASFISRSRPMELRPPSVNLPPRRVSVDDYSVEDRRFLSDHPSSWVHGDDSNCSSLSNSRCSSIIDIALWMRHQNVPGGEQQREQEQQADLLSSERPEEVVLGATDGLRFTYSPVSSAFVFTRSTEDNDGDGGGRDDDDEVSDHDEHYHHRHQSHNNNTGNHYHRGRHQISSRLQRYGHPRREAFDSEHAATSRRFSNSRDFHTNSVCSIDDSLSFARGSEVTELGLSRAESWSKVVRGGGNAIPAFQQHQQEQEQHHGYQDAEPSSFPRRACDGPFEFSACGTRSADLKPRGSQIGDCADSWIIRRRPSKKFAMVTCLPFRSILRTFKANASRGRSPLGPVNTRGQLGWTSSSAINWPPY